MKSNRFINILILISLASISIGDRVVRKDGRVIEGTVTSKTNSSVVINSNTGQLTIPLSEVANIEQGAATNVSPLSQANYERQKGNYEVAFKLMRDAYRTNSQDSSMITTYQNTFNELYNRAKGNQKNTPDSAAKTIWYFITSFLTR